MSTQRTTQSSLQRRLLVIALVIIGLGLVVVFGGQAYHNYRNFEQASLASDVEAIRGWMTLPYIARAYDVPEATLFNALGIPRESNECKSIRQIARAYQRDLMSVRQAIQQAILNTRPTPTHPSGGTP